MAIKITKPGQKEFHGFCTWCGCEFTYEISDLKLSATGNKLDCPSCGKDYFHQSMAQDPTIPGGIGRLHDISWPPDPIPCTPYMTKTDPCAGCVWRENLLRDGLYTGDTPCTWCDKNKFNNIAEYNQNFKDYITCAVKTPEAHLTSKECNCDENAVCSKCSGTYGTITVASGVVSACNGGDPSSSKTIARDTDFRTPTTCICNGNVWKTIEDCCECAMNDINNKSN